MGEGGAQPRVGSQEEKPWEGKVPNPVVSHANPVGTSVGEG